MNPDTPGKVIQSHRVFFALWPDTACREKLADVGQEMRALCGGRALRRETLHITLAFIGEVTTEQVAALRQLGNSLRGQSFDLMLDRLVWQRRRGMVWAAAHQIPPALLGFAQDMGGALQSAGFPVEFRPFSAHVTLIRHAHRRVDLPPVPSIAWHVSEFVLMESELAIGGANYTTLDRWSLAAA